MMYRVSINLQMPEFPHAAVDQFFTSIEDALEEVKESLTKSPDLPVRIEAYTDDPR